MIKKKRREYSDFSFDSIKDHPGQKTVLVVEDDPTHRAFLDKILKSCGLRTFCVENGFRALSVLTSLKDTFDLILMDWEMPEMNGLETVKIIRKRQNRNGSSHIPIIAFTSNSAMGDREKCLAAGMDGYLPKNIGMVNWRSILVDNLQGLLAGEFDLQDYKDVVSQVPEPQIDVRAFDPKALDEARIILKGSFVITVEEYLEDAAAYIEEIRQGLEAADLTKIAKGSHPLKSNSKSFGLTAVSELCEIINKQARENQSIEQIAPRLVQLQEAFAFAEKRLHDVLQMHQN